MDIFLDAVAISLAFIILYLWFNLKIFFNKIAMKNDL